MKRTTIQRIEECRKALRESGRKRARESNREIEDVENENREIITFAKKLLEKEGFTVRRMRETDNDEDFEDKE